MDSTDAARVLGLIDSSSSGTPEVHSAGKARDDDPSFTYLCSSVESGVVAGFQLATANGPLCDEPMWGVAFQVCLLKITIM